MKRVLLILPVFALLIACKKEEVKLPFSEPVVVRDQVTIERNMVGAWKGIIAGSNGRVDHVEVTIAKMSLGAKAAEGKYFDSTFLCDFEWRYEGLTNGMVTFRENILASIDCFDNLSIVAYFQNENFNELQIRITGQNLSFSGALTRE